MKKDAHYIDGGYAEFIMLAKPLLPYIWPGSVDLQVAMRDSMSTALMMRAIKNRGPDPIGDWYRKNYERDPNFDFGD